MITTPGEASQSDKKLTYSSYLKVGELLDLQQPLSKPVAHDELLFIVIHQVYELWFKQLLFELETLVQHLDQDRHIEAFRVLQRTQTIFNVLIKQIDVLETMTPTEFARFRAHLNPASGFQSFQFRELELLSGADPAEYERFFDLEPEWKQRLQERARKKSLRDVFFETLARHVGLKSREPEAVRKVLGKLYGAQTIDFTLQTLCEHLIQYDELVQLWRFRHVQMVERMIGMKMGTGGSLGVPYLMSTLKKRFFPELWQVRTDLGGSYG